MPSHAENIGLQPHTSTRCGSGRSERPDQGARHDQEEVAHMDALMGRMYVAFACYRLLRRWLFRSSSQRPTHRLARGASKIPVA